MVQEGEPAKLKAAMYTNMALCYMKMKNYAKAKDAVSRKCIEYEENVCQLEIANIFFVSCLV